MKEREFHPFYRRINKKLKKTERLIRWVHGNCSGVGSLTKIKGATEEMIKIIEALKGGKT